MFFISTCTCWAAKNSDAVWLENSDLTLTKQEDDLSCTVWRR